MVSGTGAQQVRGPTGPKAGPPSRVPGPSRTSTEKTVGPMRLGVHGCCSSAKATWKSVGLQADLPLLAKNTEIDGLRMLQLGASSIDRS